MAQDPRKYLTVSCGPTRADAVAADADKRNFFSNLGKIGDIELLNEVNGGKISAGLRTLASISDSIRDGKPGSSGLFGIGAIAGSVLDKINTSAEAATNAVLGAVGIDATAATIARDFNPGVVNRAVGQARGIADKVRNGNFNVSDIPSVFQDIQNLDILLGGIYTPDKEREQQTICEPSPYATDLVRRQPKFKFLFVVEFKINSELFGKESIDSVDIAFVVHNSTRPTIEFDYEELNMYNLRTRVPKRTSFGPMTMRFYDDDYNQAFDFYTQYLKFMSPIANLDPETTPLIEEISIGNPQYSTYGKFTGSSSSLGALAGETAKTILNEIRLYHLFNWGQNVNIYRFYNPRITSMQLDDLSMAESGPTEVSLEFSYDGVNIVPYGKFDSTVSGDDTLTSRVNLQGKSQGINGAFYPLHYTGGDRKEPFTQFKTPEISETAEQPQTTVQQPTGATTASTPTTEIKNDRTPIFFEQEDGSRRAIRKDVCESVSQSLQQDIDAQLELKAQGVEEIDVSVNGRPAGTRNIDDYINQQRLKKASFDEGVENGQLSYERYQELKTIYGQN